MTTGESVNLWTGQNTLRFCALCKLIFLNHVARNAAARAFQTRALATIINSNSFSELDIKMPRARTRVYL